MIARNVTQQQLEQALAETNKQYDNNIEFVYPPISEGKGFRFTLRVKESHGKGARLGFQNYATGKQRHLINACWHVHGNFFDNLLNIEPNAVIKLTKFDIFKRSNSEVVNNWQDWNIGSQVLPMYYSDACECK